MRHGRYVKFHMADVMQREFFQEILRLMIEELRQQDHQLLRKPLNYRTRLLSAAGDANLQKGRCPA